MIIQNVEIDKSSVHSVGTDKVVGEGIIYSLDEGEAYFDRFSFGYYPDSEFAVITVDEIFDEYKEIIKELLVDNLKTNIV